MTAIKLPMRELKRGRKLICATTACIERRETILLTTKLGNLMPALLYIDFPLH
jgi:hypothetical protein